MEVDRLYDVVVNGDVSKEEFKSYFIDLDKFFIREGTEKVMW